MAVRGYGVLSLLMGALVTAAARSAYLVVCGLPRWRPRLHFHPSDLKPFLSFGLFQMGERSLNYLAFQLDKIFIGSLLGAQALGYYAIAYELMSRPLQIINPIFTRVAFPVFANLQDHEQRLRNAFLQLIRVVATLLMPVYFGMMVLAEPLITVLLGRGWEASAFLLQILAILGLFYSIGNPFGSLLLAKGKANIAFYLNVLAAILYGAAIWGGSAAGTAGIAWALVLATGGVLFPLGFWLRWRLIRLGPAEYTRSFLTPVGLAAAAALAVFWARRAMLWPDAATELVALTLLGAALYLPLTILAQGPRLRQLLQTAEPSS
jgi:O-antigen/teichoic acid export membrane protein